MFKVIKVLNNNALLANDTDKNNEVIFLGKGVGFGKTIGMTFDNIENAQQYYLLKTTEKGDSLSLINNISPLYIEIAGEIMNKVRESFEKVNEGVLITLADHIFFYIERIKNNIIIDNPFVNDIKALYPKEFEIAKHSKAIIKNKTGFDIDDGEIGYITLHIHSSLSDDKVSQSMRIAMIIHETIKKIEEQFNINIDSSSLSYRELMTHVNYMIARIKSDEELTIDINDYIRDSFSYSYNISKSVCSEISKEMKKNVSSKEIGYLTLYIERIINSLN